MAEAKPTRHQDARHPRGFRALLAFAALAICLAQSGCATTQDLMGKVFPRYDESLSNGMVRPEDSTPQRFLNRFLNPNRSPHASGSKESDSITLATSTWTPTKIKPDPKADAELEAATRLYRQGKHDEAQPLLAQIAKNRKGTPWGERAQYLLAESYYENGQYVWANDAYTLLAKDYQGSLYIPKIVPREYEIAQKWFAYNDPKAKNPPKFTWMDRFRGRLPLIDESGYAIKTLEHIRDQDPTGPLSDDAVMRMGDYYYSVHNYEDAAMYYEQLTTDHPKSEHLHRAYISRIDALLKSYVGPEYDGKPLKTTLETIDAAAVTFPEKLEEKERLYHIKDVISDEYAERQYRIGLYYKKTNHVTAAEHYFGLVNAKWPKTEWAAKSRTELASLAKMPRKESLPSKIMTQPGSRDPFGSTSGPSNPMMGGSGAGGGGGMGGGGMGGMGMGGMGMGGMGMPG
jgi:outer membrane protein assembly factor BamD (BamD/ComL family)